jgi:phospholipid-translocating ATPase
MTLILMMADLNFVFSVSFAWKVAVLVGVSTFPLYVLKLARNRLAPASYAKLRG